MLELKIEIKDSETGYAVTKVKHLSPGTGTTIRFDAIRQELLEIVEMIVPACENLGEE